MQYELNDMVRFESEGKTLEGRLTRIVKMSAPCVSSSNPSDWDYHVTVTNPDIRLAGTYCLQLVNLKGIL